MPKPRMGRAAVRPAPRTPCWRSTGGAHSPWAFSKREGCAPRTKAGHHDRITVTGIPTGATLTPYIKCQGPNGYRPRTSKVTVAPEGTYARTRSVRIHGRISAYFTYAGSRSNTATWRPIR